MRVLVVENEVYLAQSIAAKLQEAGFECDVHSSAVPGDTFYDVILLSTSVESFMKIIQANKDSVIILLISYVSQDTVSAPIKAGAIDYIQKPFMIDELIRKIEYFSKYKYIKNLNEFYKSYICDKVHSEITANIDYKKVRLPVMIRTNRDILADSFAFNYISAMGVSAKFYDLKKYNIYDKLNSKKTLYYLTKFHLVKPGDKEKVLNELRGKNVIVHSGNLEEEAPDFNCIDLVDNEYRHYIGEIITVDEYIKNVIITHQNTFPDTELSRRLGISRKSIWERRRRYEVSRKK